ncbi:alpha-galactosidase [Bifidobacterium actinocoloniiforme DSM 22766]|uniref:Alpha-galactosidase n=1 Tax=Bifidobacterium actinocoloniiforme DSM 22766 TaxID=1437605 RepID=A0A086YYD4_9BIFI|nr:alpha-galactosidase [Bifidobacterium actinocoloniiforme]AKV55844.1 alpha-galactosidase [Bifidobacterium actinocoloniiforme DSM 22766]KFI39284.1 alpha-galactosidase [Bifidobacterium actinocoloniiforme DSM 22766]
MTATQSDPQAHEPRIIVHESQRQFHLTNGLISYIMKVDKEGKLLNLYFGAAVSDREDFGHLVELQHRSTATCRIEGDLTYSLDHLRQEYPEYGNGDYRRPAISVLQPNGSTLIDLQYDGYEITDGKPSLQGLPASYAQENEATTLLLRLKDAQTGLVVTLSYTIFSDSSIIARSAQANNAGQEDLLIERMMSLSIDMPDSDYEMTEFTGAWARERHPQTQRLHHGIQQLESLRNASSHYTNPTALFSRPDCGESQGEALGLAFVYSGDFDLHAEVDSYGVARLQLGINDADFSWRLKPGQSFQTPEALLGWTDQGLNLLSRDSHRMAREHIMRAPWKDRDRPVLINNWEATYFDFDEDKLVAIASKAKEAGVELFVLDDGWFGARNDDTAGLGDWTPNRERLPEGLPGLAKRINGLGMQFGLWFEPETINKDSDLYRAHPDWAIHTPGRHMNHGRNEFLLNFANAEVVDNIYEQMYRILSSANISYVKWDMNRYVSEAFDATRGPDAQGEFRHRYILGVYELMQRLLDAFPELLIEGCASGGGRFDMGMLYYTPQIWCSDDTDAVERMKTQYGTSYFYPPISMGAHVSVVPNHQTERITPIHTRGNVALFGAFGYELDLAKLSDDEMEAVNRQVAFYKKYRGILRTGDFYRLRSPYTDSRCAWMVVSQDRKTAIIGDYLILLEPNGPFTRLKLEGLDPNYEYLVSCTGPSSIDGKEFRGDELMRVGMIDSDAASGELGGVNPLGKTHDFDSRLFVLQAQ